jgi:very-short-patch-repair endonuclease
MWAAGAGSQAEVVFHLIMDNAGITGWEANARVWLDGKIVASVDVLFGASRLVVEIDGWGAHGSRGAFQKDRTRQNALVQAGYRVLRFTWEDLTRRPDYCVGQVRRALANAE